MPQLILEAAAERDKKRDASVMTRANLASGAGEGESYLPVERLREQYINYLTTKAPEIEEQKEARRYYHGAQWSAEDIRVLRARKQPVTTFNKVGRKINGICGLVERVRQDPKGFPRSPKHEEGAEVATTCIREILDASDWRTTEAEVIRHCAIDGLGGIEMRLTEGDHDDPDIEVAQVFGDDYFYDPRSYRFDFADARYEGIAKWMDVEEAIELFPDKEDILRGLIQNGSDLTTYADREFKWVISTEQQVRLVEHWYRHKGKWCWAFYISNVLLDEGVSPFRNKKGKTERRFRMFSAAVDHDGDRYGFVRGLKSGQDEVNQRRSKALHLSNTRRLMVEKGTVENIQKARDEWAKADGIIEVNPGKLGAIKADDTAPDLAAQSALYNDAKDFIDNYANVNVAELAQGTLQNLSGRAINLLQQPGLAELGPFILAIRSWKLSVYRGVFMAAQTHWTSERWFRVTDDGQLNQFLQVNGMELDEHGLPVLVNYLGALDVDIILDEGPDVVSLMQDTFDLVKNDPNVPLAVKLELAPIQGSVKQKIRALMQPPPPDPMDAMAKKAAVEGMMAETEATQAQARASDASVIEKRSNAVKNVMAAVQSAAKAGLDAAQAEAMGVQSAPIAPAPPELGQPMPLQPLAPAPMLPHVDALPPDLPPPSPIDPGRPQFPPPPGFL